QVCGDLHVVTRSFAGSTSAFGYRHDCGCRGKDEIARLKPVLDHVCTYHDHGRCGARGCLQMRLFVTLLTSVVAGLFPKLAGHYDWVNPGVLPPRGPRRINSAAFTRALPAWQQI